MNREIHSVEIGFKKFRLSGNYLEKFSVTIAKQYCTLGGKKQSENGAITPGHRISCGFDKVSTHAARSREIPMPWQLISKYCAALLVSMYVAFSGFVYLVPSRKECPT